jgi:DNA-binding transcriptional ArsR family regulator
MDKKLLLQNKGNTQEIKEITLINNPQKLKMALGTLSWKILTILSKKEAYPLEIARQLGMHEQKIYYHIRKLARAGVITVSHEEKRKGATARYYKVISPAFGIEFQTPYKPIQNLCTPTLDEKLQQFFKEYIDANGLFDGKIVVGSPLPHGPFKTSARDGHYAAHLSLFMGQFTKMPANLR